MSNSSGSTLSDKIFEAALVPERWNHVLGEIATLCGASSGALLIIDRRLPPLFACTPNIHEALDAFARSPIWYENPPAHRLKRMRHPGFLERHEFFTDEERVSENLMRDSLRRIGAAWQVGSVVDLPGGEMALFTFERPDGHEDFTEQNRARLDGIRPNLARASLLAARMKLVRAEAQVAVLSSLGMPAAVVNTKGIVVASNAGFDARSHVFRPGAFGALCLSNPLADQLLQDAIVAVNTVPQVFSIPVPSEQLGETACVVHVLPLRREARDIFDTGGALLVVTSLSTQGNVPADIILRGLFDLTPAEAIVATGLASGQGLQDIASARNTSIATVRTHLAQVFRKTGTINQAQLVALLKGMPGFHSQG